MLSVYSVVFYSCCFVVFVIFRELRGSEACGGIEHRLIFFAIPLNSFKN